MGSLTQERNRHDPENYMKKKNAIVLIILWMLLGIIIISPVMDLFKINADFTYQGVKGFYAEKANSLDAVYFGTSNVHSFWQPPLAWKDHGIAVYSFSVDAQPVKALPYMLEEAHKTQPQALFIINLNRIVMMHPTKVTYVDIHRSTNYMPFSLNKMKMIHNLANAAGFKGLDQLEFYFPIIRFHSSWPEMEEWKFTRTFNGLKHALTMGKYLNGIVSMKGKYTLTEETAELTSDQIQVLGDLLDFCDRKQLKVLFVGVPQAWGKDNNFYKRLNTAEQIIRDRGYDYFDGVAEADEIGIRLDTDFYNFKHINVHGSIKFTEYLAQYLIDNYGFSDKRGLDGWESWDRSAVLYDEVISPYALPFEMVHAPRNWNIPAAALNKVESDGRTLVLSWKRSEGADGYDIYRKSSISGDENWAYLASTDSETVQFADADLVPGVKYTYTVVPKVLTDGQEFYGQFYIPGVSGTVPG